LQTLLLEAPPIPSHALAALLALALGAFQLARPKGGSAHRALGWLWIGLMAYVAGSSFWISEIQLWGRYSPIHLLSVWTLGSLVFAVAMVRLGNIKAHRMTMQSLFFLALVVTGLFTLMPGRVMHTIIVGS
jgi:uncharacterized membrane protein